MIYRKQHQIGLNKLMVRKISENNFRMTRRAYVYINSVLEDVLSKPEMKGFFPLLLWIIEKSSEPDFVPGLNISLDDTESGMSFSDNFYIVGDRKLFLAIDELRINECKLKILDYRGKRLVLIYEDDLLGIDLYD